MFNTNPVTPTTTTTTPTTVTNTQAVSPVVPETVASNIPDYAIKTTFQGQTVYYDPITQDVYNTNGTTNMAATHQAEIDPSNIGVKTADASKVINQIEHPGQTVVSDSNTSNEPFKVTVSGAPANEMYNPHNVVAPEGYHLANEAELTSLQNSGVSATKLDNGEYAWIVPNQPVTVQGGNIPGVPGSVSNLTIIPPNSSQPSNLQVAHVTVNPTDLFNTTDNVTTPVVPNVPVTPTNNVVTPIVPSVPITPAGNITTQDNTSNVTIIPPNSSQPSNLQVAHVTVNPTGNITPTGNINLNTGPILPANIFSSTTSNNTTIGNNVSNVSNNTSNKSNNESNVANVIINNTSNIANVANVANVANIANTQSNIANVEIIPYNPNIAVTPPIVNVPVPPIANTSSNVTPVDTTHYGTYTWGNAPQVKIPTGLNPGYIQPTPFYQTTNPAQAQYYWGSHPYQPGSTFDSKLYNTVPNAPITPWGATSAQRSATPQEIIAAMQGLYPNFGTQTVTGPAVPIQ